MELSELLGELVEQDGSDLHLLAGEPPVFRVDGALVRSGHPVLAEADIEALLEPYVPAAEGAKSFVQRHRSASCATPVGDRHFHLCTFRAMGRLGAAIRVAPLEVPTLDRIYPEQPVLEVLRRVVREPRGLVLVTGATGSGKTTTVYSMLEEINRTSACRIVTIEDPIEYRMQNKEALVTQHEVGRDVESFELGAVWAFQQDPDVVFIAELRDLATIHIALTLAETGHLVFTLAHLPDVSEAVARLVQVFPEPRDLIRQQLGRNLVAVVAQMLLPKAGAPGRVAANEVLLATDRIRRMVADGTPDLSLAIEAGRDQGMRTMDDSILEHFHAGRITYETAWSRMREPARLGIKE